MRKIPCLLLASVAILGAPLAVFADESPIPQSVTATAKQQVSGTVIDSDGEPVVGASVIVVGTQVGTMTDIDGHFTIAVPKGGEIRVSYIGHKPETIKIGNQKNLEIKLESNANQLGEVEITAEFGMKRVARAVGSSVQNVKAKDIIESGRDNFITALQGRVSGMTVTSTNGAPGASTTVTLRSATSISGSNQPLYVVDGIPMNNSTFDPSSFAGAADAITSRDLDFSSRGNDFNPEDIESMTVLKGAAAAALYGSDASNGAIIITTKKGNMTNGKGRVNYSNSFSWSKAYGWPEMQDVYGPGAYGATHWYYSAKYGSKYPEGTKLYDNMASVLQTGHSMKHNVSVETGTQKATLRAGASFLDQTGVVKTTDYDRTNLSLSGKAEITKWLKFEASMQYTHTSNNKVAKGSNGPIRMASLWPMTDNMADWMDPDGSHMRFPSTYTDTDILNPLFGMYKNKNYDESDRFLSNAALTINLPYNIFVRAQAGWDVGAQTFETSRHPYYSTNQEGVGSYNLAKSNFNDPTLNFIAGYGGSFFGDKFTVNAQVGYHQVENGVNRLATNGTKFSVVDFQSINNCDPETVTSVKRTTKRRVQAISAQAELGYANQLFLTLRARNDWSSTLPKDNNSYFYPAAELAWVPTDLRWFANQDILSYLKLRGSVAQVGKDASPLSIYPELETTDDPGGGYRYGFTGPNLNLKPEMTTSYEFGFETRLFHDRVAADFTYFRTHCADQIVNGFRLSYATGFVLNNLNVGTFNTWGWEAHIDGDIITGPGYRWNVGLNLSATDSKVVYLPENVSEYYNAYTWVSGNIRNGIMVGQPITSLTGRSYERNEAGDILISPTTGLPLVDADWSIIGNREPKLKLGITTSVNWKGFYLNAMFSGRLGATVVNHTKRDLLGKGMSMESVHLRENGSYVFNGVLKDGLQDTDHPTYSTIAVNMSNYGSSIYTGVDDNWVEKNVNYLRMQELRLSYTVPTKALKKFLHGFVSNAMIYVSGNDLFTWTNYSGIDAVGNALSAAGGGTGGEGFDVWGIPNPRTYSFGVSLTFN